MPYPPGDRLNGFYCLRRSRRGNGALKLHARLQVMNTKRFSVNGDPSAVRHIGEMPDGPVFHLDHQVVALHEYNLAPFDLHCFGNIALSCGGLRLYLSTHAYGKCKTNRPG